jgi:hypothetical protein
LFPRKLDIGLVELQLCCQAFHHWKEAVEVTGDVDYRVEEQLLYVRYLSLNARPLFLNLAI